MGGRRGVAEEELMGRPQHVCPNKGCRGYALGSDDEQEGAQHHRRRGDEALVVAPKHLRSTASAQFRAQHFVSGSPRCLFTGTGSPRCLFTGKKTPGEPGHTHGTRGRTKAHGPHRRTSQPSKPTNNTQPARQRDDRSRGRLKSRRPGVDRPRGRLRRGHPQRTRPCLHPLPERLPAPARRRSAK